MMEEQKNITTKGGTMRLGAYPCDIKKKVQKLTRLTANSILPNVTDIVMNLTMPI